MVRGLSFAGNGHHSPKKLILVLDIMLSLGPMPLVFLG